MKIELTHNNHFKFGYDGIPFNFRESIKNQWWVSYGKCKTPPLTFHSECINTAKIIHQKSKGKSTLLFSGGVDSEVVLQSFILAKLPIKAAILRFKNELNIHDISYAIIACEKLGVPYYFFDLDILKFWESNLFKYANPTYCSSPQLLSTMWLIDQINEFPVLGSGECLLVKDIPKDYVPGVSEYGHSEWKLYEKEKIASWYRHFMVRNRDGCPGFFQYTPELILSYILDPFVKKLTGNEITGKLCTASSKLKIYQQHFDLIDRPKFTGFEKIQNYDSYYRNILLNAFPDANQVAMTPLSTLKENMSSMNWTKNEYF